MKNREEEGKWKNERKWDGGGTPYITSFFPIPLFYHMSLGNQFIVIKEFMSNNGISSAFIH